MGVNTCIVIVGPTAVGKTSLAIRLAKLFNTAIISADSRQCYLEMNIGVAKPAPAFLREIKHYFINSHSITQEVNAGLFEQYALSSLKEIFFNSQVALMVGGTGLYVQALCEGMDEIPVIVPDIRNEIIAGYKKYGLEWLQQRVKQNDPAYFDKAEIYNPQRLMRSLEVNLSTGRSIQSFHTNQQKKRNFLIKKIGLELPREILYQNINKRVDEMITEGLIDEVRALLPFKHLNALNTVGYKEIFGYLEGQLTRGEAIEAIKKSTRHYSKRQLTWFKKDGSIRWFAPDDLDGIMRELRVES